MAGRKLSLNVALKLAKEGFERGMLQAQASVESFRRRVLSFTTSLVGGGLALGGIIKGAVSLARTTQRAEVTLRNITKSQYDYVKSLQLTRRLAKEYGQDLNDLTFTYAKMRAAGDNAGLAVETQEKMYKSFIRTFSAFNMTREESSLAMLALEQMLSKGKISAEELRRQLGEKVPIAMGAMANAAGVPISQLDTLLKQGKLLSSDIMPKFAQELERLTPNIDTDNIETALRRLRNTFVELVEKLNISDIYKRLIKGFDAFIKHATKSLGTLATYMTGVFGTLSFGSLNKKSKELGATLWQEKQKEWQGETDTYVSVQRGYATAVRQKESFEGSLAPQQKEEKQRELTTLEREKKLRREVAVLEKQRLQSISAVEKAETLYAQGKEARENRLSSISKSRQEAEAKINQKALADRARAEARYTRQVERETARQLKQDQAYKGLVSRRTALEREVARMEPQYLARKREAEALQAKRGEAWNSTYKKYNLWGNWSGQEVDEKRAEWETQYKAPSDEAYQRYREVSVPRLETNKQIGSLRGQSNAIESSIRQKVAQDQRAVLESELETIEKVKAKRLEALDATHGTSLAKLEEREGKQLEAIDQLKEKQVATDQQLQDARISHSEAVAKARAELDANVMARAGAREKALASVRKAIQQKHTEQMQGSYALSYRILRRNHSAFSASLKAGWIRFQGMVSSGVAKMTRVASLAIAKVGAMLKMAFSSLAFGAVLSAITFLINKIVEAVSEARKFKNVVQDTKNEIEKAGEALDETTGRLQIIHGLLEDGNLSREEQVRLMNEANGILGLALDNENAINDVISSRLKLRRIDNKLAKSQELYNEGKDEADELYQKALKNKHIKAYADKHGKEQTLKFLSGEVQVPRVQPTNSLRLVGKSFEYMGEEAPLAKYVEAHPSRTRKLQTARSKSATAEKAVAELLAEQEKETKNTLNLLYRSYNEEMASAKTEEKSDIRSRYRSLYRQQRGNSRHAGFEQLIEESTATTTTGETTRTSVPTESPLERAKREYGESLETTARQQQAGLIEQDEADKEILSAKKRFVERILSLMPYEQAFSIGGFSDALTAVREAQESNTEYARATDRYNEKLEELARAKDAELLSSDEYQEQVINATRRYLESALVLDDLTAEQKRHLAKLKEENDKKDIEFKRSGDNVPTQEVRDTTFDYKKQPLERVGEELELLKTYSANLENFIKSNDNGSDGLDDLKAKAQELKKAIEEVSREYKKLQVVADREEYQKVLTSLRRDALKGVADSLRDLTQGAKTLWETLEGDGNAIEKILALVNVFIRLAETLSSLQDKFGQLKEAKDLLDGAKTAVGAMQSAPPTTEIARNVLGYTPRQEGGQQGEEQQAVSVPQDGTAESLEKIAKAQEAINTAKTAEKIITASLLPIKAMDEAQSRSEATAHLTNATAKTAEANASIPVVGAIMAVSQIAMLIASVAKAKSFAKGGLVDYGSTFGDTTHAFVNRGERILSRGNQEWLEGLTKNVRGSAVSSSRVEVSGKFELENRKLVASINRENQRWERK